MSGSTIAFPIIMTKRDPNDNRHVTSIPGNYPPLQNPATGTGINYPGDVVGINFQTIKVLGIERLPTDGPGPDPVVTPAGSWHEDPVGLQFLCSCDGFLMYLLQAEFEPQWLRYTSNPE